MGIVVRMLKADPTGYSLVHVAIPRRELVAIEEKQEEVHLVSAVGIGGMPLRLNVGRVVVQDVEDKMRLGVPMMRALQGTWLATSV
jgi:hypothetical protein